MLTAERANDEALAITGKLIADVRTGNHVRALAHHYAATASAGANDMAAAERHHTQATLLAPGSWFA